MNNQEIEKALKEIAKYMHNENICTISDETCDIAMKLMQQQLTNGWIPVSEPYVESNLRSIGRDN